MSWERLAVSKESRWAWFQEVKEFQQSSVGQTTLEGMLTNPNTLVSRLFKARYFPQGSILEAPVGNNPSFVWHSILAGKELIVQGLAKRIGDNGLRGWLLGKTGHEWIKRFILVMSSIVLLIWLKSVLFVCSDRIGVKEQPSPMSSA